MNRIVEILEIKNEFYIEKSKMWYVKITYQYKENKNDVDLYLSPRHRYALNKMMSLAEDFKLKLIGYIEEYESYTGKEFSALKYFYIDKNIEYDEKNITWGEKLEDEFKI